MVSVFKTKRFSQFKINRRTRALITPYSKNKPKCLLKNKILVSSETQHLLTPVLLFTA